MCKLSLEDEDTLGEVIRIMLIPCSSRVGREVELPVHPSTSQHQRRWQAEDHVRLDQNQGCRSSLLQLGLQESRCGSQQAVS